MEGLWRKWGLAVAAVLVFGLSWFSPKTFAGKRDNFDVEAITRSFLDAYARGDRQHVLPMVDPAITAYGSDLDEVFKGKDGINKMLQDDAQLWKGAATIGVMQQVSTFRDGDFASIFFNASFRLGEQEPIPIRFAMVWHRTREGWRLIQSSNVVPTTGQSAERLLRRR